MNNIKVGSPVKDKVSGFRGHSIARCVYLNGCVQHEVQAEADKDNKIQPNLWIDESQLEDLTPIPEPVLVEKEGKGNYGGGHRGHK